MNLRRSRLSMISCVVLVSLIVYLIPCHSVSAEIKDVPQDHWAYQSVKLLVDKGYLGLYADGTFQGTRAVDRYTLAMVVARLLNEIGTGRIGATPEDVELLRALSGEFREELVLIASELEIFKNTLDEHEKAREVAQEDIAKLNFTQREMKAEVDKIIAEIVKEQESLASRITQVEGSLGQQISDARGDVSELASRTDSALRSLNQQVSAHVSEYEAKSAQLEEGLGALVLRLNAIEPQVAVLKEDVDSISLAVSENALEIARSKQAISELDERVLRLTSRTEEEGASFTDELDALRQKTLSLEETLRTERGARVSTYTSLESGLSTLSTDLAAFKAQTAKDLDGLRKENGLLKVLLGLVAVLGIVIK